ncbi:hypothetical protein StrepF001_23550 [Streptomyces sp. F001]|nr:hypothetical protein StrepF001_23550 [Streptomyces sp. F001]
MTSLRSFAISRISFSVSGFSFFDAAVGCASASLSLARVVRLSCWVSLIHWVTTAASAPVARVAR